MSRLRLLRLAFHAFDAIFFEACGCGDIVSTGIRVSFRAQFLHQLVELAHADTASTARDATVIVVCFCEIKSAPNARTIPTTTSVALGRNAVLPLNGLRLLKNDAPGIADNPCNQKLGTDVPVAGVVDAVGATVDVLSTLPTPPISDAGTLMTLASLTHQDFPQWNCSRQKCQ